MEHILSSLHFMWNVMFQPPNKEERSPLRMLQTKKGVFEFTLALMHLPCRHSVSQVILNQIFAFTVHCYEFISGPQQE